MAKTRRMEPHVLAELLAVHATCVHAHGNRCPLLVSVRSLCWEINQFCGLANDEDRGFKTKNEMLAARPLRPERFEREDHG